MADSAHFSVETSWVPGAINHGTSGPPHRSPHKASISQDWVSFISVPGGNSADLATGLEQAEERMQAALKRVATRKDAVFGPTSSADIVGVNSERGDHQDSSFAMLDDRAAHTAPWIHIHATSPIMAICVATNARILEIHGGAGMEEGSTTYPPLFTHESPQDPIEEWCYTHYVCNATPDSTSTESASATTAPLLPPSGAGYRLKLFGRRPRRLVHVACLCVVVRSSVFSTLHTRSPSPMARPPSSSRVGGVGSVSWCAEEKERTPVPASMERMTSPRNAATTADVDDLNHNWGARLSAQLGELQLQMSVGLAALVQRVEALDTRLSRVEKHLIHPPSPPK